MDTNQFRSAVSSALDPAMRKEPGLSHFNKGVAYLIVISSIVVVLETEPSLSDPYGRWFHLFESFVLLIFSIEYVCRVWSCIENPANRSRILYASRLMPVIDLLVLAVMVIGLFGLEGTLLRLVRLARFLRVARLGQLSQAMQNITAAVLERRFELLLSFMIAMGLLLLSASALYVIEGEHQPEAYGSIPRAMWWSIATLTTVGYGDIIPMTPFGKFFAALTALTGIGLIAMPAGILASAFSSAIQKGKTNKE